MIIYLDSSFICHLTDDGTMRAVETDVFDGKCKPYIEGYRYVPEGETWVREDGTEFVGIMVSPVTDSSLLEIAQQQYEEDQAQMLDMQNALEILGVNP